MDDLTQMRQAIDELDDTIMDLLDKRFELSKAVGEIKKHQSLSVSHPDREKTILKKAEAYQQSAFIKTLYTQIFTLSKKLQK